MSAIGALNLFAPGHMMGEAPLVPLMRDPTKIPHLVVDNQAKTPKDNFLTEDTKRLRAVWDMEKRRPGVKISQKAMALEWGVNASNITQYLNGHIKLNTEAKLRFAAYLKKPVLEIWPHFSLASVAPGELSPDAVAVATLWTMLPVASRKIVVDLLESLSGLSRS
jgi:hypothetical protein